MTVTDKEEAPTGNQPEPSPQNRVQATHTLTHAQTTQHNTYKNPPKTKMRTLTTS